MLRQERLQAQAAGSAPGQSCVWRRNGWGNSVASAGLRLQSCAQPRIARPAPGPHQARTRPQSDFGLERGRISDFAFLFGPKESGDEAVTPFLGLKAPFWDERAHGGVGLRRFDFSPVPWRADMLESGNFGGNKLRLPCYVEEPRRAVRLQAWSSAGCRVRHWLTLRCASAG